MVHSSRHRFGAALFVWMLLSVTTVQAGFFYGKQRFNTIKTEHFKIHFAEGLGPIAEEMRTIVEEQYVNVSTELEWKPKGRTHVVLSDKTDQANGLATVMPTNYILLYVTHPSADSSLDVYRDYLRMLFRHEFTHIVHIDMHHRWATPFRFVLGKVVAPNGATPTWMREGMAVVEESKQDPGFGRNNFPYSEMLIRTAVYENKFPKIGQINGSTPHYPSGVGPYNMGGKFFEWLGEKYGQDRITKYQHLYASGLWVFSLNNKARRVYGKSFYKLWREFEADMTAKYTSLKGTLEAKGLTSLDDVVRTPKNSQRSYTVSPDGQSFAYYETGFDDSPFILIQKGGAKPIHIKRKLQGQLSFSENGRYVAFSTLASIEPKSAHSEVYYYDTEKKSLFRVYDRSAPKKSMRASDPDFSPADGGQRWLVMVRKALNTDQLYVYDLYEKKGYFITNEPKYTQLDNPRFSPDGNSIVVSRKDASTGFRDIVIYSKTGEKLAQITSDISNDQNPIYSRDGRFVYFDSYRTGVSNIHRYDTKEKTLSQVSNVLDGVFQPMPSPSGQDVYVQRYNSEKEFIQKFKPQTSSSYESVKIESGTVSSLGDDVMMTGRNFSVLKSPDGVAKVAYHPMNVTAVSRDIPDFFKSEVDQEDMPSVSDHPDLPSISTATTQHQHDVSRGSLEDDVSPIQSIGRFAQNPDNINLLPEEFYGNLAEKTETTQSSNSTEATTSVQKDYPSAYRDQLSQFPQQKTADTSNPPDAKKYNPFPALFVPTYVVPNTVIFENAVLFSVLTGKTDPLYRHAWTAFANYRSDAKFVGGGATYLYTRYDPIFYAGGLRYAVDWGQVNTTRFFEERAQGYGGVSFAFGQHKFNTSYFYEHRSALTNLAVNLINMKPYAGVKLQYSTSKFKKFADSVSQENGYSIDIGSTITDSMLGADDVNEEKLLHADFRYYLEMPWSDHHALAFRVAGGWVWGDIQQFGVYRLGGPFGEGVGFSASARLYPLRGLPGITFGGDRVFMFSGEYRLPLWTNVNTGVGTMPIFLDKVHMSFFVDGGDIKFRTETSDLFSRMMVATGAEIKGDFVFGYGLPLTLRLGYGVILTNRDRLGTLTDSITRASVKYGSAYFQLGTMF